MSLVALIPAYNPPTRLIGIVRALVDTDLEAIVVINDGSSREKNIIFEELDRIEKVVLIKHAKNLGKGAALKTGLIYTYHTYKKDLKGVVTADADGQHLPEDILKIARTLANHPGHLVLGARDLKRNTVPLRSRVGNSAISLLFRLFTGETLKDTQTGLRGIPRDFIPELLTKTSNGYEFELEMLLACVGNRRPLIEREIETVYMEGNRSYFNSIIDSLKVLSALLFAPKASSTQKELKSNR